MPPRERLTGRAYRIIRDHILQGELPAGTPLSRRRLAAKLGMSPVPVADALTRLENEGLVESRPSAGTRVKIPTAAEIRGQYVLREALETHAARLFAESAAPGLRRKLRALARALDRRGATDSAEAARAHFDFHLLIAQAADCSELTAAIERSRVLLSNWLLSISTATTALPSGWHSDLAKVLAQGSPEAAAEAMRMHVRHSRQQAIDALESLRAASEADRSAARWRSRSAPDAGRKGGPDAGAGAQPNSGRSNSSRRSGNTPCSRTSCTTYS